MLDVAVTEAWSSCSCCLGKLFMLPGAAVNAARAAVYAVRSRFS